MYALHHLNAAAAAAAGVTATGDNDDLTLAKTVADWVLKMCIPGCIMKQIVNVFQLTTSCNAVAKDDAHKKNKSV
jgi:hypothetical protein